MKTDDIEACKKRFADCQALADRKETEEAVRRLKDLLSVLESDRACIPAGSVDRRGNISLNTNLRHKQAAGADAEPSALYISLNHVTEYYIFDYYFKPEEPVAVAGLPYGQYYRTCADLCLQLGRYKAAADGYRHALEWNPVDLDAVFGLAEACKYLNMLERYLLMTRQAYRYCCTRATMARYYRNMGYYYLMKYRPELARACYCYSNLYYRTAQADSELKYLETALKDRTPDYTIPKMQAMFDANGIEPGPERATVEVIYQVGKQMIEEQETKLAKDCFLMVYDITQEKALEALINEL